MSCPRSSRQRYLSFVKDYIPQRVNAAAEAGELWPYRFAAGTLFALALLGAGLEMVEALFITHSGADGYATRRADNLRDRPHRLSTVRRANLILRMDDGRIIERGTDIVVRQMESAATRKRCCANDSRITRKSRLKGGCSQDWLPHRSSLRTRISRLTIGRSIQPAPGIVTAPSAVTQLR